jgi:hypothetical protein
MESKQEIEARLSLGSGNAQHTCIQKAYTQERGSSELSVDRGLAFAQASKTEVLINNMQ